jgi:hypothetical protein
LKLFPAGRRNVIYASAPFVLSCHPFGTDAAGLLQAVESWIEGAFLNAKHIGNGLNLGCNPVAMERAATVENLEDQKREGTV